MPYCRGTVRLILACSILFLFYSSSASQSLQAAPAAMSGSTTGLATSPAQYPNTAEGLQSLLNDMLAATKRGDRQGVDALVKQTEFADYAAYFVRTYNPNPLAGEDWDITYRQWLGNNENQLRGLLEILAKDEGGRIRVRNASDDRTQGRGFEWGIVHYARIPIDLYCVTLIFNHSPDGPEELIGYFAYADGMFRWDSIVPFAKPGSYQSKPNELNGSPTQAAGSAQYPNTPDGLQEFLSDLRAVAKSGDQAKVDSMIKQTEIPEYRNWFCSVYIPGSGLSWANPYGNNLAQNEMSFKALWEGLARDDGEIQVRKLIDKPGGDRGMEWGMLHNSRTPLDMYYASWKSAKGAPGERIGYFFYIDGVFRWDSLVSFMKISPAPKKDTPLAPSSVPMSTQIPVQQESQPPTPVRVSQGLSQSMVVSRIYPMYPKDSKDKGVQGPVKMRAIINQAGEVAKLELIDGDPLLAPAAMDAIRQWKYRPYVLNGNPVEVETTITFNFTLSGKN
jgi:TonB family protein